MRESSLSTSSSRLSPQQGCLFSSRLSSHYHPPSCTLHHLSSASFTIYPCLTWSPCWLNNRIGIWIFKNNIFLKISDLVRNLLFVSQFPMLLYLSQMPKLKFCICGNHHYRHHHPVGHLSRAGRVFSLSSSILHAIQKAV